MTDNTYQVGILSYIEAGLGITAASLAILRPLSRLLRDRFFNPRDYYHSRGSFPLSSDLAHGNRIFPLKDKIDEDGYRLWGGSRGLESHQGGSGEVFSPDRIVNRSKAERSDLYILTNQASENFGEASDTQDRE